MINNRISSGLVTIISLTLAATAAAQPSISSGSGTVANGQAYTITGTGFGSHDNYGSPNGPWLNAGWNSFETSLTSGGWAPDGFDPGNVNLSTSSPRGGASGQFFRKTHTTGHQQGSEQFIHSGTNGVFYTSFWYRESASSPELGNAACSKYFRHYMADAVTFPAYNFYFGPAFENGTGFVTPPAELNRYSGTAAFGGDPYHPQNLWRFMEVIEFLGTATSDASSIYGSADYFEHRLNNTRLLRRGTGLTSNHIDAEGTDTNENQRWVGSAGAGTADGHDTALGSHLCDSEASSAYMDFDDVYISYTIARVMCGNASTFATSTAFEMQLPTAWSSTSITVTLNRGALSSMGACYLYVINEDNEVNANGFLLSGA